MATKIAFPTPPGSGYNRAFPLGFHDWAKPLGNVFFVDSNHASADDTAGHGHSPEAPFATLAYAFSSDRLTADNHDYVVLAPGHVETITAAAGVVADIAGVTVLGLGRGRQRPKINFTTAATADFDVTAARVTLENLFFDMTSVDSLNAGLEVVGADFTCRNCEFELSDASGQADVGILTSAAAVRFLIEDCVFHGAGDTTAQIAISLVGGDDGVIRNCYFAGYFGTTGAIQNATTAATNLWLVGNTIHNRTADGNNKTIVVDSSTVAYIVNNRGSVIDSMSPAPVTATAGFVAGNYWSSAAGVTASVLM